MTHIFDSALGEHITTAEALPLPTHIGRRLQITIVVDDQIVQYDYYIDAIDTGLRRVFVTLQKVYLNGAIVIN